MALLLVHAAVTWAMVGVIWYVQLVRYPRFTSIPKDAFPAYQADNIRRMTRVVGPLMVCEGAAAAALAWRLRDGLALAGLAALVLVWVSTAFVQLPLHRALRAGFDSALHRRLLQTNWVRTIAWSVRGVLALWMFRGHG